MMKQISIVLSLVFVVLMVTTVYPQYDYQFTTESKKALKYYKKAEGYYRQVDLDNARIYLFKSIEKDSLFKEAWLLLGDVFTELDDSHAAIDAYNHALQIDSSFFPRAWYFLGLLYSDIGDFKNSVRCFRKYQQFLDPGDAMEQILGKHLLHALQAEEIMKDTVEFNPIILNDSVNTAYDEYINSISADGQMLIFTRKFPVNPENYKEGFYEKLYSAEKINDTVWSAAVELPGYFNELGNIGALTLSSDGRYIFLVSCNDRHTYGSCDLFYCRKYGDEWGRPENLGEIVNTGAWESTPTFSTDGKTLYFASNRRGGKGSSDIWKSELQANGRWSEPQNLGLPVNTSKKEMAPYIHADDKTLYFSSNGHPGLGYADLFVSRKMDNGLWKKPVNLGYPINTTDDEINLVIGADGKTAFISKAKSGENPDFDIYQFELPGAVRADAVTYMKGFVKEIDTHIPLQAEFELTDLETELVRVRSYSDETDGSFLLVLPLDKNYALHVTKPGYLFYSESFTTDSLASRFDPIVKDIYLKPIREGEVLIMNNVFFETNKYNLKPESYPELNSLIELLKANPGVQIEIGGHTDSIGTSENNQVLSENRAKSVMEYLVAGGIAKERMSPHGYGEEKPIADNASEKGRAVNRRTEVRVLSVE